MPKSSERPAQAAVTVQSVKKRFHYDIRRAASVREVFIRLALRRPVLPRETSFSLGEVDLCIRAGEAVALVGRNGSGKSTLLRLIAGIYTATEGQILVRGRVAPVMELGAGFHPELSGKDNIAIYGAVLGISRRELASRVPDILSFAEIRVVPEMPLKHYSSGMQARLALAVALCSEPDILLLDEALSVGDLAFRRKVLDRVRSFHAAGGTVLLVTHDFTEASEVCPRTIWFENGCVRMDGATCAVLEQYGGVRSGYTALPKWPRQDSNLWPRD